MIDRRLFLQLTGKCGSVLVRLIPAPRGTGIVSAPVPKKLLSMAGVDDCYTSATGQTATLGNFGTLNLECANEFLFTLKTLVTYKSYSLPMEYISKWCYPYFQLKRPITPSRRRTATWHQICGKIQSSPRVHSRNIPISWWETTLEATSSSARLLPTKHELLFHFTLIVLLLSRYECRIKSLNSIYRYFYSRVFLN